MRRGLENVDAEWTLVSLAWNLKRMYVLAKPPPKTPIMAACKAKSGIQGQAMGAVLVSYALDMVFYG